MLSFYCKIYCNTFSFFRQKAQLKCKGGAFNGEIICCKEANINLKGVNEVRKDENNSCGRPKSTIIPRIFSSGESELSSVEGEFPWIAAIFYANGNG